jgi:tetratricopeptide (TPR) repeat protein
VAKYKKKRARELRHDRFRDTTMNLLDRAGNRLEGRGRPILYALGAIVLVGVVVIFFMRWSGRKNDEARQALGRAIGIATATVTTTTPINDTPDATFSSEEQRAQRAIEEFQKVADKYGDPYHTQARFFIASNKLILDRQQGIADLTALANSDMPEVAALAKFALAQTKESDGKLDEAAQLYSSLASTNSQAVTPETANLRLAKVLEKQGKKKEAVDLLFAIVDASRKAKGEDNLPLPASAAAREAADELKKLDPDRFAQLPPEASVIG